MASSLQLRRAQVFGIAHLRRSIFEFHCLDSLSLCPEPATIPNGRGMARSQAREQAKSIAPLLALHGYRSAAVLDELQRRPAMLAYHLYYAYQRAKRSQDNNFLRYFTCEFYTSCVFAQTYH